MNRADEASPREGSQGGVAMLGELALRVNDLAAMREFYRDVVGLQVWREGDDYVFFKVAEGVEGHPQALVLFDRGVDVGPETSTLDHLAVRAAAAMWKRILGIDVVFVSTDSNAAISSGGWFPGYPDPEYYLRLLLHSEAQDNHGRFHHEPYDELIERARTETDGRRRLELFHAADRMAVAEQVAVIPLAYGRNVFLVKPWVHGWWEYGKSWPSFADLVVSESRP